MQCNDQPWVWKTKVIQNIVLVRWILQNDRTSEQLLCRSSSKTKTTLQTYHLNILNLILAGGPGILLLSLSEMVMSSVGWAGWLNYNFCPCPPATYNTHQQSQYFIKSNFTRFTRFQRFFKSEWPNIFSCPGQIKRGLFRKWVSTWVTIFI